MSPYGCWVSNCFSQEILGQIDPTLQPLLTNTLQAILNLQPHTESDTGTNQGLRAFGGQSQPVEIRAQHRMLPVFWSTWADWIGSHFYTFGKENISRPLNAKVISFRTR